MSETKLHPRRIASTSSETKHAPRVSLGSVARAHVAPAPTVARDVATYPAEVRLRFLREIGTRAVLHAYWKTPEGCDGRDYLCHGADVELAVSMTLRSDTVGADVDLATVTPPTICKRCGQDRGDHEFDTKIWREPVRVADHSEGVEFVYEPKPGDYYFVGHDLTVCPWSNCSGDHLIVICPDGAWWDTNSRANNCTLKEDKTHRCWVVHGDPRKGERPTVDKGGHTCAAGAGSIQTSRYHGHLVNGVLRNCDAG